MRGMGVGRQEEALGKSKTLQAPPPKLMSQPCPVQLRGELLGILQFSHSRHSMRPPETLHILPNNSRNSPEQLSERTNAGKKTQPTNQRKKKKKKATRVMEN